MSAPNHLKNSFSFSSESIGGQKELFFHAR